VPLWLYFFATKTQSQKESLKHLETLYETKSFLNENKYKELHDKLELLGKKINLFIQSVQKQHISEK
jgi:hypothetical protein